MQKRRQHLHKFQKSLLLSALLLEFGLSSTQAATINVDGTICNLADAITSANTDAVVGGCTSGTGDDVLELTTNGTFTLSAELPEITANLTINGNGSTISRDSGAATDFRILRAYTTSLTLNDSTISGGSLASNYGAGVQVFNGRLTINNSTISGNTGGAVSFYNSSSSSITNSVIDNNDGVVAQYYGGGVNITGSQVVISNSTISNNTTQSTDAGGGGVYISNYGGSSFVLIENTTIANNSSTLRGGGISHLQFGSSNTTNLIIKNTTITGNSSNANGGGISIDDTVTGTFTNLTVTGNTAGTTGGGLEMSAGAVSLGHSLLSGNTSTGAGPEANVSGGTLTIDNTNIFGFNSLSGVIGATPGASDIIPTVALAALLNTSLADNGGTTMTHGLPMGSPAIDAISATSAADCLNPEDQIATTRGNDGDNNGTGGCDVGALEHIFVDLIFKNGFE